MFNKNSVFTFFLGVLLIGCTHSPTNSNLSNSTTQDYLTTEFSTQKLDFISPILNDSNSLASVPMTSNEGLIWGHIENRFALTEFYDNPRIIQQKEKFIKDGEYLTAVTKRSEPFIHFVLSEIESRNMPAELAILPIVESG
ncbi:MAG: hypothetical protein P8X88_01655, partial [Gammaproteobacteria bacterium]